MKNCLQAIRLSFSRELTRHLAARLGERENAVGKALKGMVPMVLCQLVIQVGEGEGRRLFSAVLKADWPGIRDIRNLTEVLALLGGGPDHSAVLDAGEGLLSRLFEASRPGLDDLMCEYAGLRPESVVILLRLVMAMVAAGLAKYALRQQLNAVRLSEELGAAKNQIYSWLPADFPRWPGFRRRVAVKASHAVWAAELARPYWVLVLAVAGVAVLALLVLGALAGAGSRPGADGTLLAAAPDSVQQKVADGVDSTSAMWSPTALPAPVTW